MIVAGIDVGKASLDVSVAEGSVNRFDNTMEGISKLLKHLAEQGATVAVCEATGGYERLVVDRLRETGIHMQLAQPTNQPACEPSLGPAVTKRKPTPGTPRFCPVSAACSGSITQGHRLWNRNSRSCGTCCAGVGSL